MKKLLATFILISICSCKSAVQVKKADLVWLSDLETAKGDILLEFSTEWCPYCKFIDERVFNDLDVARRMSEFVLVKIDGDKPENQKLMDKFAIKGFPTFIILNKDGRERGRFNDVSSVGEFMTRLDQILLDRPGYKELKEARSLEDAGDGKRAGVLYKKASVIFNGENEEALRGLLNTSKDDRKLGIEYSNELIKKFSESPRLPDYYKQKADFYSSTAIKNDLLKKAAAIISYRLEEKAVDEAVLRITLDEHIDLLADIYKGLKEYDRIRKTYLSGAELSEDFVEKNGGIAGNLHMIGTITYYYISADKPEDAVRFLDKTIKVLPNYWPVYSNYAKALIAKGDFVEAASYFQKAYDMAEKVARPKVALLWADTYASMKDYKKAIEILSSASNDLEKTNVQESGRAKRMFSQLKERIKEYELL